MSFQDQLAVADSRIADAAKAAAAIASKVKELRSSIRDRFVSGGEDRPAREAHSKLTTLISDSEFAEAKLAALQQHRNAVAAEIESQRQAAEARAKREAFAALIKRRTDAAEAAEAAAQALGRAVQDMAALTTEIKQAASSVGMKSNIVEQDEIRYGVEFSLYQAGLKWMYAEKPLAKYDAQGKPTTTISARIAKSGAALLSMLEG